MFRRIDIVTPSCEIRGFKHSIFLSIILAIVLIFFLKNIPYVDIDVFSDSAIVTLLSLSFFCIFYAGAIKGGLVYSLALMAFLFGFLFFLDTQYSLAFFFIFLFVALLNLVQNLRHVDLNWPNVLLNGALIALFTSGLSSWTSFNIENDLIRGLVHKDILYHSSLAAMIKNYGVVSTGVHGLVDTPYHILSHAVVALFSKLSGLGVLKIYGVILWVFLIPLMIFSLLSLIASLMKDFESLETVVVTILLLFLSVFKIFGFVAIWDSYLTSESYVLSLSFFSFSLLILHKKELVFFDFILFFVFFIICATSKFSSGGVLFGLLVLRVVFFSGVRPAGGIIVVGVAALALYFLARNAAAVASDNMTFSTLSFVKFYIFGGDNLARMLKAGIQGEVFRLADLVGAIIALIGFCFGHFILFWARFGWCLRQGGGLQRLICPDVIYGLAVVALSFGLAVAVKIPGGALYYISNLVMFISLPFLVMSLSRVSHSSAALKIGSKSLLWASVTYGYHTAILEGVEKRDLKVHSSQLEKLVLDLNGVRETYPVDLVMVAETELFKDEKLLSSCATVPFVFVAVSERPWIGLLGGFSDCNYSNYGYSSYFVPSSIAVHQLVSPKIPPGFDVLNFK